jgi:aldose sugar dehydrogenase
MFADRDRVGTLRAMRRLALILPLVLALAACGGSAADGARTAGSTPSVSTVATGLRVPWEIAFLPGGDSLITERPGRVRLLTAQRSLRTVTSIPGVVTGGENGLLGLALDPDFARNRLV